MRVRDPLGAALTTLWTAGHIAAFTLLGVTVFEHTGSASAAAAVPDLPLTQPDPPPTPGDA
ncbi:hypothetical protein [Streptomyces sp. NPDC056817]|uniref:hypothetical protein n=1 Tax=Streptomyces sp. NPDC056817 TaxID=3345950 RepID=UPI0036AA4C38